MAYTGFVGSGTVGHFPTQAALDSRFPAASHAGRTATVDGVGGTVSQYFSNGSGWDSISERVGPVLALYDEWSEVWFHHVTQPLGPYLTVAVLGGNFGVTTAIAPNADGLWQDGAQLTSAATANSGCRLAATIGSVLFGAKPNKYRAAYRPLTLPTTLARFGFHDTLTVSAPTDGAWIDVIDGLVSGKTSNNSVSSTTPSSFLLTSGAVYVLDCTVNAAGTGATFSVFSGTSGALLWSDTLDTNLPTPMDVNRVTGAGCIITSSGAVAIPLAIVYMMGQGTPNGFHRKTGQA